MEVVGIDERDSGWEDHSPCFRVYLFDNEGHDESSWSTETYDITGADVFEVVEWASEHAGDGAYAVALVHDETNPPPGSTPRGLVWLVGHDANGRPLSTSEQHLADRMHQRRRQAG